MLPQTKVFVGSLPPGSKPEELRRLFERFGVVTECDVMNRCGFVHMQTEEQASNAIHALNNTSFNGGVILVERGRIKDRTKGPRGPPPRRPGGGGPVRGGPMYGVGRDVPYMRPQSSGYDRPDHRYPPYDDRSNMNGYTSVDVHQAGYGTVGGMMPYQDNGYYQMDDRHAHVYHDDRGRSAYPGEHVIPQDRRGVGPPPYDRPRNNPVNNGDSYGRRSPPQARSSRGSGKDPYDQDFPPLKRGNEGSPHRSDAETRPRKY